MHESLPGLMQVVRLDEVIKGVIPLIRQVAVGR